MLKFIIILMAISSCASARPQWSVWKMRDVASHKRIWRFCSERYDGPEKHRTGFCYISSECREKKRRILRDLKECRPKPLYCKWGDIPCMEKYNILSNRITPYKEIL